MFHDLKWLFVASNWITAGTFLKLCIKNTIFESTRLRFDFWQWIFLTKKQCSFYWRNRQGKSCSRTPALILTSFTVKSYIWNTIFEQSSTRLFWYKNSENNCTLLPQTYLYSILQTRLKIYLVGSIVTNSTNFKKIGIFLKCMICIFI